MAYRARPIVASRLEDLVPWLTEELRRISQAFRGVDEVRLTPLHVEPSRPRDGMLVLADGTDWDPGSGEGIYAYYNSTWNKL